MSVVRVRARGCGGCEGEDSGGDGVIESARSGVSVYLLSVASGACDNQSLPHIQPCPQTRPREPQQKNIFPAPELS
jgi:hypothetical protein